MQSRTLSELNLPALLSPLDDPETVVLTATNVALGILVLGLGGVVLACVLRELLWRHRREQSAPEITYLMQDGGEPLSKVRSLPKRKAEGHPGPTEGNKKGS